MNHEQEKQKKNAQQVTINEKNNNTPNHPKKKRVMVAGTQIKISFDFVGFFVSLFVYLVIVFLGLNQKKKKIFKSHTF